MTKHYTSAKGKQHGNIGFSYCGLREWISNPALAGHTAYGRSNANRYKDKKNWDIVPNTHESLLSPIEAQKSSEFLAIDKNIAASTLANELILWVA